MKTIPSQELKLCVNCKHYEGPVRFARCKAIPNRCPITGGGGVYCENARHDYIPSKANWCGREGRLFEPKPTEANKTATIKTDGMSILDCIKKLFS